MKKIMLTALVLIATSLVSYAQYSKAYNDAKKITDAYEQSVNNAKSCEELDNASINFFIQLMGLVEVEYDESEEMTEKENELLEEQIDRITNKVESMKQQFDCPIEEEEEVELIPTTTQEWDELINSYENVTKKLESFNSVDYDNDDDLNKLMEVLTEAEPIVTRIDNAETENMTEKQSKRLDAINDRFLNAAKRLGFADEDEE
ncbi:MAG: hypothetical protein IKW82_07145 [Bacteroidales bacterium]|nr:hypothetical protein [Bacteroidales bacterium]